MGGFHGRKISPSFQSKESCHVPTENRQGHITKVRSKIIRMYVRVGHANKTVRLERSHSVQGTCGLTGRMVSVVGVSVYEDKAWTASIHR
jgi:hypothetical protein